MTVKLATFSNVSALNVNRFETIRMMADIENINESLPALDCGSCGAPTCRAFAEDVVKGDANIDECIVHMRERLKNLMSEMEKKQ
jgi:Na+-translocating ferredoxin:NAD+ oxidoreductase RNF subunit RnfB